MKLFFDENLSHNLVDILANVYPKSTHVKNEGLKGADDSEIWSYCKENGFVIVSKDTDFRDRSFTKGFPPKIIWLDIGNAGTMEIANILQNEITRIERFIKQKEKSLLILSIANSVV